MADLRPFLKAVGDAVGPALQAFFLTAAVMSFLALVLAGVSYAIAADGSILRGAIAVTVTLAVCTVAGFTLSWKRALGAAILQIVRRQRLGGMLFGAVFERLLGVDEAGEAGARGGRIAQAVERVPLNDAAQRLRMAVIHQVRAAPQGGGIRGFLRRKIEARMLGIIERLTLARFRDEAGAADRLGSASAGAPGVDLIKVRDELAGKTDDLITGHLEGALLKLTLLLAAAAGLASIGAAFGIERIPL